MLLIFLVQYPLGWIFHYCVYSTFLRHLWNIVIGAFIQFYFFRDGVVHVAVLTLVAYAIMAIAPRKI